MMGSSSFSAALVPQTSCAPKKRKRVSSSFLLREEELAWLWEGQRFPRGALRTGKGELLEVVYRGRRSPGPGPDFVDAIFADERGRLLKGDVELHVLASAFHAHGHDRDPRYDGLVLHLVFEDDLGTETILSSGRRVDVVALAPWVARRREELRFWLTQPALWEEPCKGAVARLGWPAVRETVLRMGEMRFRQKEARFAAALGREDAQQVMYEALLRTLGYRENAEAFSALARAVPYRSLRPALSSRDPTAVESLLLEAAGLAGHRALPSRRRDDSPTSGFVWATVGIRPVNHPRRRLAGAARLLVRKGPDLLASLRELLDAKDRRSVVGLARSWEVAAEGAWSAKTAAGRGGAPPALIGRGRAIELLVNAVLPLAAAHGARSRLPALSRAASFVFRQLPPSGPYGAVRFLESSLRPPSEMRESLSACYQQGLLYLYHQYCAAGGCDVCPFRR
jgi:hypothetical protein